jgi:hypothetical protein
MNGVLPVTKSLWGLESRPQLIKLNDGAAWCETKEKLFLIPTHHSQTLWAIKKLRGRNN